jgi:L-lactate dehydrogenase (cytochrome)
VKAATRGPCWYQLYLCGGRDVARGHRSRGRGGYSALVVTIDRPSRAIATRSANGTKELLSGNPLKMSFVPQLVAHPRWLVGFLADGGHQFPNVVFTRRSDEVCRCRRRARSAAVRWADLVWIRASWRGPIVVKVSTPPRTPSARSTPAPTRSSVESRRPSARHRRADARALPEVVDAVNGRIECFFDGGIRRGADVGKRSHSVRAPC